MFPGPQVFISITNVPPICYYLWIHKRITAYHLGSKFRGIMIITHVREDIVFSTSAGLPTLSRSLHPDIPVVTFIVCFQCSVPSQTAPPSRQHLLFPFSPLWTPVTSEAWKISSSSSTDSKGWGEPSASQNYGLELPWTGLVMVTWRWKALYSITSVQSNLLNPAPLCLIETLFSLCYPGHSGQCNSVNLSADFHLCRITFLAIRSTGTNLLCSFLAIQY